MGKYTNETLLEGIKNHTTINNCFADGLDGFNGSVEGIKVPANAAKNKAAWEKAYNEYGSKLGLRDKKAYLHLLAQVMHESGSFLYMKEIGAGQGKKYGVPAGPYNQIYYGRGPVQVTWESNYKQIYEKFFKPNGLGDINIWKNPDLCNDPYVGSLATFGWFLTTSNGKRAIEACNNYDVEGATKAINGGKNGLKDRQNKTAALLLQNNLA